ncbi:hypothetical protein CHS0354_018448 [Potamilus streckersoni]|uniref:Uncharacterized protein n=1 Tax=Potamilus streckersoni TaxID=2493646 RepID=A0AAE0WA92_9BIVA|nr:hypothetical protein CHS0354_018448 [Potamilus streckersoni]
MPMLAALISSQSNLCTDRPTVFMGEVSLTGRFSLYPENTAQLADLSKMGFSRLVVSASALKHIPLKSTPDFEIIPLETITDLYAFIRSTGKKAPRAARPSAPAPAQPADGGIVIATATDDPQGFTGAVIKYCGGMTVPSGKKRDLRR